VKCKAPDTPADKVSVFRSLFRGRADVFPTRFVSKTTGNPDYAPACANKWEPGLCLLRAGGKCGDCVNQAFIPVDNQVVTDHLRGRHVIGCYPLLEDETCWFLAVDFDKNSWKEDVAAFDYVDRQVPMLLRMFEKRLTTYRAIGYAPRESPIGLAEPAEERTVEYDHAALEHHPGARKVLH
jgi:hypothetical protein